ncbi:hypothetical protein A6E19_15880 [Pseudomonas putida]|nr:hypothetical protein A6E24_16150 [Pseudomonas putida]OCT23618.1 hypothetical protein A6E23_16650 [Pseudomonas putida]OCT24667.1 hypothetical protein A6E20_12230 [Pseudomonas putida]OCT37611.1 hypothetical protein A6E19_15880 [Pseudomonas putida]
MSTTSVSHPPYDLCSAVAAQFANRPTLREVLDQQVIKIIVEQYPLIAIHRPEMTSAQPLSLLCSTADDTYSNELLIDHLLQLVLDGKRVDFASMGAYALSLNPYQRLFAIKSPLETSDGDLIKPDTLVEPLEKMLSLLPDYLQQAQIGYWNGDGQGERDLWLQQVLRASLLQGLDEADLEEPERACLRQLLLGNTRNIEVQAVRVQMHLGDRQSSELLPGILVTTLDTPRPLVLWCQPDGEVRSFESLAAFGRGLQLQMARRCEFDRMSWSGFTSEGDAFALQSGLLLEILLERQSRVRWGAADSLAELERRVDGAFDPSQFFAQRSNVPAKPVALSLPAGIRRAGSEGQTTYLQAMLDLTLLQGSDSGERALDGVDDLHTYAARRLREEMLADHPVDANYFADDLLLTVDTFVNDGHGLGFGQKIDSRTVTLTELAIGRLAASQGGVVTHIAHRNEQLVMDWMNVDYIRELVARVDIGGTYPTYVNDLLADATDNAERIARFGRQWRITLMFDAARAVVVNRLNTFAYGAVARFCRDGDAQAAGVRIAPLAFRRSPTSEKVDRVHGFYVIEILESGQCVLYCPMYTNGAVHVFKDADTLMGTVRKPGKLQNLVLMWMDQNERPVYDNGGFNEPHLPHWVFDPFSPLDKPDPAQLALEFWAQDIDARMFQARHLVLLELADRSAVSNSELRWGVVIAFGWELLNAVLPVLPGPVVSIAWLYMGIRSLASDVQGLGSDSTGERIQAVIDLLNNTLLALIHLQTPRNTVLGPQHDVTSLEELPVAQDVALHPLPEPERKPAGLVRDLYATTQTHLDFSWRGNGGLNALSTSQRSRVRELAVEVSLAGHTPDTQGATAGLTAVDGKYYVKLGQEVYQVVLDEGVVRIVGPDLTSGPCLYNDGGGWRIDTRLQGGGGRGRTAAQERLRQKIAATIQKSLEEVEHHLLEANKPIPEYLRQNSQIQELRAKIAKLEETLNQSPPTNPEDLSRFKTLSELYTAKRDELSRAMHDLRRQRVELVYSMFEHQASAQQSIVELLDNPNYTRTTAHGRDLRQALSNARHDLIGYGVFLLDEAVAVGSFREYDQIVRNLSGATPEHRAVLYAKCRELLEGMVLDQPRIMEVSSQMDHVLAVSDIDMKIQSSRGLVTVAQVIGSRKTSTVMIRFFQAMSLVELALRFEEGASSQHYKIFRDAIASYRLRVAVNAHHLSMFCELPIVERIEVLQGAWDEYLAAILNCDRISKLGSALVDTQRLAAYREQMVNLKKMAGDALVEAMREQASGQTQASRRMVYPLRALQVARTLEGQTVLGTEVMVDGQAQLQIKGAFSTKIQHRFKKVGGTWLEEVESTEPESQSRSSTPESEKKSRELAEGILAQNESVIEQAKALVSNDAQDSGLISMLDAQIAEVLELREQLADADSTDSLLGRLDDAVIRLRDQKRECLVELYTKTRYPGAQGLSFLHQQGLITVEYVGPRKPISDGYLDEYRINLLKSPGDSKGRPLWAAHFHFADSQAAPTAFGKGHLKLWSQRKMGYREQMRAASEGQVLSIYRGNLTYTQAKDVIPFNSL